MKKIFESIKKYQHIIIFFFFLLLIAFFNQYLLTKFLFNFNFIFLFLNSFWIILFSVIIFYIPPKISRFIALLIQILLLIITLANYFYIEYFQVPFSFKDLILGKEGASFIDSIFPLINIKIIFLLVIFIIIIVYNFISFKNKSNKLNFKKNIIILSILSLMIVSYAIWFYKINQQQEVMNLPSTKDGVVFKDDNVYYYQEWTNSNFLMKNYGFYEYIIRDFYIPFVRKFNYNDMISTIENTVSDINPPERNDYTGLLKGKNLILVMMESMDDWQVNKNSTPTINYMIKNGINFKNHYSLAYVTGKTAQSEFMANTGIYEPINGVTAHYAYSKNAYPYSLPNLFKKEGYSVNSFHVNTGGVYNRYEMHLNLGYEEYYATLGLGIDPEKRMSDRLMAIHGYPFMTKNKPFMDFIITISPHTNYEYSKPECSDNLDVIKKAYPNETSETILCGYAQAYETDLMFKILLEKLQQDNLLKDTVIVGFTDHANNVIFAEGENTELNRTVLFVYNEEIKPLEVNGLTNTIDILPLINNLFDLQSPYFMAGYDPLNFKDSYLVMPNYKLYQNDKFTNLSKKHMNDIIVSKYLLETDYYNK